MTKISALLVICLLAGAVVFAAPRFWVGPSNGNWNDSGNWSESSHGPGGASAPGAVDSVIIDDDALINMDGSSTISALQLYPASSEYKYFRVSLYTGTGAALTILNNFHVFYNFILLDSTSANVPFNIIFNGATNATGRVEGLWVFHGSTPVTGGNGATLTAETGSFVTVVNYGEIVQKNNTAYITCEPSTLRFYVNSYFTLENNLDGAIPNANFEQDYVTYASSTIYPPVETMRLPGSSVYVIGKFEKFRFLNPHPSFRLLSIGLSELIADANLGLDGAYATTLNIGVNTGNHTFTLLSQTGSSSTVSASVGTLVVSGKNIAMATGTGAAPETSYRLGVRFFTQSSGNFSLQDFNGARGTSTLAIQRDMTQTGGTFITNSTSTDTAAHFVVEMNGPESIPTGRNTPSYSTGQFINMKSGSIDNGRNKVTLKINNFLGGCCAPAGGTYINVGVTLKSPLKVGQLQLLSGALNTTDTTLITVTDPDPVNGIIIGPQDKSFVNGPLRRITHSTAPYIFPVRKGMAYGTFDYYKNFVRAVSIVPGSNAASEYQAEHVSAPYKDLNVAAPLKGVSNAEYWNVSRISGANASIVLNLNGAVPGASASDGIVAAHYTGGRWVSGHGTILQPGNTVTGSAASKLLSDFGPITLGYGEIPKDTAAHVFTCLKDTSILSTSENCSVKVSWSMPPDVFPQTVTLANGDVLRLKGTFNGHGYYESGATYTWPDARNMAAGAGGHLVTITSAAENSFVRDSVVDRQVTGYEWIGLYNSGKAGQFSWVTGEPVTFTDWMPGEPNNLYGLNNPDPTIFEPYVHINPYAGDQWNDNGNISARFIAEFESPAVQYRQYSGPENGSVLDPGLYTVRYEITDSQTGKRDSCSFNITVVCRDLLSTYFPRDSTFNATVAGRCMTYVFWPSPDEFPYSYKISATDRLVLKGVRNGHAYYESGASYTWPEARRIAAAARGHLVTITDPDETDFMLNKVLNRQDPANTWLGLVNTGEAGRFRWITGEPLAYTNWMPGEPNNLYGLNNPDPTIFEPYVHINPYAGYQWNDNGNIAARIVLELDSALVGYRLIGGPPSGSFLPSGEYTVCYQYTDYENHTGYPFCFRYYVSCRSTITEAAANQEAVNANAKASEIQALEAVAFPNPSAGGFSIKVSSSNSTDKIKVQVTDAVGRIVEVVENTGSNKLLRLGSGYKTGVYFASVTQGSGTVMVRLVRQ